MIFYRIKYFEISKMVESLFFLKSYTVWHNITVLCTLSTHDLPCITNIQGICPILIKLIQPN